jgi:toxin-antitoxin system PIN domain toxin
VGYLLDINVLIARADPAHALHDKARAWLTRQPAQPLATCPLTENGFLRIYGHPNYPGGPGSPDAARSILRVIRHLPGHQFIPDSITLDDPATFPSLAGATPKHLTDLYLLALAAKHRLKFATFDRGVPAHLVTCGVEALEVIAT